MSETLATRWQVGRPAILLGLVFLLGTGLGWVVTRPFAAPSSQTVENVDYVAVVAQLYQRDHNEEVARERLALLGSPTTLAEQAFADAQSGKVKSPEDKTALKALAQALAPASVTGAAANDAANNASAGSQAGSAAATPGTNEATAPSSSGQNSWLGPVVAFILAFALGAIVLLRTAGLSLPSMVGLKGLAGRTAKSRSPERAAYPRPAVETGTPPLRRGRTLGAALPNNPVIEDRAGEDDSSMAELTPVRSTSATGTLVKPRVAAARTARHVSFDSSYRLGDEPYDEIHPITDPRTGALVAACGLSSALKVESSTASRYYAFTAWLQDYVSGEQLRAVGLVTPAAVNREQGRIDEWIREGQVDEVLPVRNGVATELAADAIATAISVVDVDHADDNESHDDYFTRLTVRFDVRWGE